MIHCNARGALDNLHDVRKAREWTMAPRTVSGQMKRWTDRVVAWRPCANRTPGVQRLVSGREYVMRTDEEEYDEEEVVLVTNAGRTLHSREIREWHAENESTPWCTQEEEVAKKSGVDGIVANISWNKVKYAIWWLGWAAPECGSTGTGSRQVPQEQIF